MKVSLVVVCLLFGPIATGLAQDAKSSNAWVTDWSEFVNRSRVELPTTAVFQGKKVTWTGKVSEIVQPEKASESGRIRVSMTSAAPALRVSGIPYPFEDLSLHPEGAEWNTWKSVSVGDTVSFTTTLDGTSNPLGGQVLTLFTWSGGGMFSIYTKGGSCLKVVAQDKKTGLLLPRPGMSENVPKPNLAAEIQDAAAAGDLAKVQTLLKDNSDLVFSKDSYGQTPLQMAASEGHKDVAELLLANKAEVNAKANNGATPLHAAADKGHKDVAELLLANKADVNAKTNGGATALHWAAYRGHKGVAELLLANKADINAKDKDGLTPLHALATGGRKDVVELLLANKANVNAKDNNGRTPLAWALHGGHADVAELLRQHGGQE